MPSSRTLRGLFAVLAAFAATPATAVTHAYITSRAGNVVDIIDTASNSVITTLPTGTEPVVVGARPDGREVWIANAGSGSITVIRATPRTLRDTFPVCLRPFGIAFAPDSTRAYVSCQGSASVNVVDVASRQVIATLPTMQQPSHLAVNANGTRLVVGSEGIDGSYQVFDTGTYARLQNYPATFRVTGIVIDDLHSVMYVGAPGTVYVALLTDYFANAILGSNYGVTALAHQWNERTIFLAMAATPPVQPTLRARSGWAGPDLGAVPIGGDTVSVDYAREHDRLYVVDGSTQVVRVIDRGSLGVMATIPVSSRPGSFGRFLVTPAGVQPAQPPTAVSAVAGEANATVSFTPSGDDGDGTVSGFRATCGEAIARGSASPIVVSGLRNNATVTCTVATVNEAGPGAPSSPSNPVTPDSPPTAPLITGITLGDRALVVHFTPVEDNFASPTLDYRVACGSAQRSGTASPITVDGLATGLPLQCTVRARNRIGDSPASMPSANITPATYPGAPALLSATSRDAAIEVAFAAPAWDGDAPISGYTATCGTQSVSGLASPLLVTSLGNGQTYTCEIAATNAVGTGAASAPSAAVMPDGPPTAPFLTFTDRGDGKILVYFIPGPDNQASATTSYFATCGAHSASHETSPVTVSGLENGVPVTCRVIARNRIGDSPPSLESTPVTPATVPGAPQLGAASAGDTTALLSFTAPAWDGGDPISGYIARCGSRQQAGSASPIQIAGLNNGDTYTCSVAARNELGVGAASDTAELTPRMPADLGITLDNGRGHVQAGAPIDYLIDVINHSSRSISGARVRDTLDAEFAPATWACSASGGSCPQPAQGTGNLDVLVNLPPKTRVSFLLTTSVPGLPELPVSNTATVTAPNDVADTDASNDSATDGPDLRVLFRDGFD